MPARPNLRFTETMILFFLVNFFFWLISPFAIFSARRLFNLEINMSLMETKINTPINPPKEVTVTALKKEKL